MVGNSTFAVVALAVVLVAVAPVAAVGTVAAEAGQHRGDASVGQALAVGSSGAISNGALARQTAEGCNYTRLYDRTIGSVVLVRTADGLGSGFVYENDENGISYVVTNEHVVNESASVGVQFSRGERLRGEVVGATAFVDLAVVRLNETPDYVEALELSAEMPRPGQRVAAIGSPFGLQSTITSGIISGVDRLTPTETGLIPNTIQTDAPINPGNSGGPLVACDSGTVVGVNRAGGGDNIGFAVSASLVERIVPGLVQNGEYDYPYLGVQPAPLAQSVVDANDLNVTQGVYVAEVADGSPASNALQGATGSQIVADQRVPVGGDVIVAVGDQSVERPEDLLSYLLTETRPGDEVELTVVRDGERRTVSVTLGERPDPEESA
ncbi:S1C family serine protease [Halorussus litoreus]|uniref:S1C family serine protease n=1 Tax=Halorussus litoreus TaxID=1710536 RepID=UPI000E2217B0|nr:trypsin-like peptidase domain-containing protein [Halorussus litoreus]